MSIRKRIIALMMMVSVLVTYNATTVFAMSDHYQTVSYPAGGYGYTSENVKNEYSTQYSTRLTGVGFIGLPAGQFPTTTTNIYFTPCDASRGYAAMAPRNYHNRTHLSNQTVKHDYYYNSSNSSNGADYRNSGFARVVIRVNSNYALGNTVGVKWNFGYVTLLP